MASSPEWRRGEQRPAFTPAQKGREAQDAFTTPHLGSAVLVTPTVKTASQPKPRVRAHERLTPGGHLPQGGRHGTEPIPYNMPKTAPNRQPGSGGPATENIARMDSDTVFFHSSPTPPSRPTSSGGGGSGRGSTTPHRMMPSMPAPTAMGVQAGFGMGVGPAPWVTPHLTAAATPTQPLSPQHFQAFRHTAPHSKPSPGGAFVQGPVPSPQPQPAPTPAPAPATTPAPRAPQAERAVSPPARPTPASRSLRSSAASGLTISSMKMSGPAEDDAPLPDTEEGGQGGDTLPPPPATSTTLISPPSSSRSGSLGASPGAGGVGGTALPLGGRLQWEGGDAAMAMTGPGLGLSTPMGRVGREQLSFTPARLQAAAASPVSPEGGGYGTPQVVQSIAGEYLGPSPDPVPPRRLASTSPVKAASPPSPHAPAPVGMYVPPQALPFLPSMQQLPPATSMPPSGMQGVPMWLHWASMQLTALQPAGSVWTMPGQQGQALLYHIQAVCSNIVAGARECASVCPRGPLLASLGQVMADAQHRWGEARQVLGRLGMAHMPSQPPMPMAAPAQPPPLHQLAGKLSEAVALLLRLSGGGGLCLGPELPKPDQVWDRTDGVLWRATRPTPPTFASDAAAPGSKKGVKDAAVEVRKREAAGMPPYAVVREADRTLLPDLPASARARLLIECADVAKRHFKAGLARTLYRRTTHDAPWSSSGWLERVKQEEEEGCLHAALCVLRSALLFCWSTDALLGKAVRHWEGAGLLQEARRHLLRFMTVCLTSGEGGALDEAGRTVLVHTAALEAHAGHADTAQSLCKLLAGPSSASPALTAASHIMGADLLVALGDIATAREVVLAGTRVAPRHGPVWPALLRVEEAEVLRHQRRAWHASWESDLMAAAAGGRGGAGDAAASAAAVAASGLVPDMAGVRQVVPAALASDCTEVAWTLQFAVAVAEDAAATLCSERLSELARLGGAADDPSGRGRLRAALRAALTQCQSTCQDQARAALAGALRVAPPSSRWRVWSLGGRLEAVAGRQAAALAILRRSAGESAPKYRSHIYLDLSRVEEFAAMTAVRGGRRQDAASALRRAGAWARIALEAAPPTDWKCHMEAAYHHLRCGRRQEARDLLAWSLQFSPAAGRLHALRLQLLGEEGDTAVVDALAAAVQQVPKGGEVWLQAARQCMNPHSLHYSTGRAAQCLLLALQFTPQYGDCFIEWARLDLLRWAGLATEGFTASTALQGVGRGLGLAGTAATCAGGDAAPPPLSAPTKTWVQFLSRENALRVRHWATWLSASPPNYGLLWAARRRHPSEPPSVILRRALKRLCVDIARTRHVYAAAAVASVLRTAARQQPGLLPRACLGPPPFVGKYSAGLLRAYTGGAAHPVHKQVGHGPLADVVDLHDVAGLAQATLDSAPSDRVWARESPVVLAPALLERGLVPGHSAHALQSGPRSGHLGPSSIMQGVAAKCAAVATSASGVVFFAQHAAAVAMGVLPHMPPDPCSVPICDGFKRQVLAQDGASVELECTDRLDFAFGDVAFSRQWLWGGRPLQPPPATNESPLLPTMRGRPLAALPPHRARQALWEVEGGSLT